MFGNGSNIRIISNQRFWEKQAEAFGKRFLNFERMGTVEISSSRAPKKWYNERVKGRQMRTKRECRRYFAVYAAYASERIVNNKESQTLNRGRFNRCRATAEGQQGLADLCPFRS